VRPSDSTTASGLRVLPRRGREARVVRNNLVRYVLRNSTLGERTGGNRTVDAARVGPADIALPRSRASHEKLEVPRVPCGVGYVDDTVVPDHDDLRDLPVC